MNLDVKSKQNLSAAKLLIDRSLHSSSIHCSYYSCFQKISYMLFCIHSKEELERQARTKKINGGKHVHFISQFKQEILPFVADKNSEISKKNVTDFYEKINQLKKLRIIADYEDSSDCDVVTISNRAYALALEILDIIKLI